MAIFRGCGANAEPQRYVDKWLLCLFFRGFGLSCLLGGVSGRVLYYLLGTLTLD